MSKGKSGNGYAGRVSHQGAQVVKPVFAGGGKAKGGKVIKGNDLRTGRK